MRENKDMRECPVVLMDFSGVYDLRMFCQEMEQVQLLHKDLRGISGTNCYCDDEAKRQLSELIRNLPLHGIHFLDSGNYHYMTRIWLTRLDQPFRLLVFDHHTDLQPPAFGGLLSCGGWIDSALRELPALQEVVLVGPDREAYAQVDETLKKRIRYLSQEEIREMKEEQWLQFFGDLPMELPWYVSIDKDILDPQEIPTTWSQGDLPFAWLLLALEHFKEQTACSPFPVQGIDVCGECEPENTEGRKINAGANRKLLEVLLKFYA